MAAKRVKHRQLAVADFRPSKNGLQFPNRFPGIPLPDALSKLIDTSRSVHGLCGGMCFTVIDYTRAKKVPPKAAKVPDKETSLYEYLSKRQMASWGTMSSQILRYVQWMTYSDSKAQAESWESWQELKKNLDEGDLTVIGLIYTDFSESIRVWDNHQVLAYGYEVLEDDTIQIDLYDPNYPKDDTITLQVTPVKIKDGDTKTEQAVTCVQMRGDKKIHDVHGFLIVPYEFTPPPDRLA
ncbi:MAG: hypothetical protein IT326_06860 [Anaerolineae bacterium]|nr:hypothetical protein [Anaerolineae bacterium]